MLGHRQSKKQKESALQRMIISSLNTSGIGHFFRIRNGATFDPKAGFFRSNTTDKGVPDIIGWRKVTGRAVLIEVKYLEKIQSKKKLVFSVRITDEQKLFLRTAREMGCIAGIAFNIEDAINIAYDDNEVYLRHPRTYSFMPTEWLEEYTEFYKTKKSLLSKEKADPVLRQLKHAGGAIR